MSTGYYPDFGISATFLITQESDVARLAAELESWAAVPKFAQIRLPSEPIDSSWTIDLVAATNEAALSEFTVLDADRFHAVWTMSSDHAVTFARQLRDFQISPELRCHIYLETDENSPDVLVSKGEYV